MAAEAINFITNSLTITVLVSYVFALWAALVVWTWFDISSRADNPLFRLGSILLVVTGNLLGFAIYLLLRPAQTKEEVSVREMEESVLSSQASLLSCPNCHAFVREDFHYCSVCSFHLTTPCSSCSKDINIAWNVCPFCGQANIKQQETNISVQAKVKKSLLGRALFSGIVDFLRNDGGNSNGRKSNSKKKSAQTKTRIRKSR